MAQRDLPAFRKHDVAVQIDENASRLEASNRQADRKTTFRVNLKQCGLTTARRLSNAVFQHKLALDKLIHQSHHRRRAQARKLGKLRAGDRCMDTYQIQQRILVNLAHQLAIRWWRFCLHLSLFWALYLLIKISILGLPGYVKRKIDIHS